MVREDTTPPFKKVKVMTIVKDNYVGRFEGKKGRRGGRWRGEEIK